MRPLHILKSWRSLALLLVFTFLGLGGISLKASAETAVISGNGVNVRSGPGTSYSGIGTLSKNTSINILERRDGWVKISFGKETGWVAEYLTSQKPSNVRKLPPISIDGEIISFDANPVTIDGCTMVPLTEIFENLGAKVDWNDTDQTATIRKCSTTITITAGSTKATINGQAKILTLSAQLVGGRTFIPLNFAVGALGGIGVWDEDNGVINIYCPSDPRDKLTAVSVIIADLNIRSEPSTSAEVVGLAQCDTIMEYLGQQDGWFQVKHRGQSGWVASWLVYPLFNTTVPAGGKQVLLPVPDDPEEFVRQMKPYAETASKGTNLPVNFLLAQWAEESGYGTSPLAQFYNNFGGIKSGDTGGFRKYSTPDEFAQDVIRVYTDNSRFNQLLAHARAGASIKTLFNDLSKCGYATSSGYGEKIRTKFLPTIDRALANL